MSSRKKVLLYNPVAVFFDMPLALLALGSVLDEKKYEVIIVDARIEDFPLEIIKQHLQDAICFGVTVITGAPIKDALHMSAQVKQLAPNLPVIWGGWHTSLFPKEPIQEHDFIDITVQGQGEETFKELIAHLEAGVTLENVRGITYREQGQAVKNPPRAIVDMNQFGRINYDLIEVEKYFKKKKRRQFDYISSIGCYFRCSFCADPFVYQRKFSAISPEKMVEDLIYYQQKYDFEDVNFQDETFFTYAKRIEALANGLTKAGTRFSWAGTMRADQGERLPDEVWKLCKKAGLRRLLIGVESGSQEMMDWMKKDVKLTQVFYCADKCKELDIAVIFPFIVGFPNESDQSIADTIKVIKQLRKTSNKFDTPIFYFKPYPGSQITQDVVKNGYQLPKTTLDWGDFDYVGSSGPWVTSEKERFFEHFKFYLKLAYNNKKNGLLYPIKKLSQWRCEKNQFKFPVEKYLIEKIRPAQKLS